MDHRLWGTASRWGGSLTIDPSMERIESLIHETAQWIHETGTRSQKERIRSTPQINLISTKVRPA